MPLSNPSTASGGSTAASTGTFTQSADNLWPQVLSNNDPLFPVSGGITASRVAIELSSGYTTVYTCSTDKAAVMLGGGQINIINNSGANSTAVDVYWVGPGSSAAAGNWFNRVSVNNGAGSAPQGNRMFMEPGESLVIANATANMVASASFWELDASTSLVVQRGQVTSTAGTSVYTCPDGKHAYVKHATLFWQSTASATATAIVVLPDGTTYNEKYAVNFTSITGQAQAELNQAVPCYLSSGDQVFLRSPSTLPTNYRIPVFETTG